MGKSVDRIDLHGLRKGDRMAQKQLYDLFSPYLLGVASLYSNSREEAQDILLEGFYRIFKDIGKYDGRGELRAWMRKVMVNSALMHLRKHKNWRLVSTYEQDQFAQIPDSIDFGATERAHSILTIIRSLPEPQRLIFTLKGIEGYSYAEIAERMQINESTLRSHYLRARKKLQSILKTQLD